MKLDDICELIVDCEHKTAPTQETGYPSIRTPNIGRGYFLLDGVNRVSEATYRLWTRRAVPKPGDLIMAREAPVGNVAMIPQGLQPCLGQRTLLIRPDKTKVDSRYLAYLLVGDEVQATIHAMTNGVTVPHLNMKDVRTLKLPPIPDLRVQQKIASALSAYDDLIENNTRRIRLLERMAQAIYREWFVQFRFPGHAKVKRIASPLGPVPQGWQPGTLGDLANELRRSVNPDEVDEDTPYIGLEHMPRKSIALAEWGSASEVQSTKLLFKRGDILFGKIRPYFHKVGVAVVDGVCSTDAIVIVPKKPEYFALVLACASSEAFVSHATQTSQGTKMPRANWDVLTKYPVPVPPEPLLSEFSAVVGDTVVLIRNLIFKNRNLRRSRDLLLPKLISGALSVENVEVAA